MQQERSARNGGPDYLPLLRRELLEVIRKYVNVDPAAVQINVERDAGPGPVAPGEKAAAAHLRPHLDRRQISCTSLTYPNHVTSCCRPQDSSSSRGTASAG